MLAVLAETEQGGGTPAATEKPDPSARPDPAKNDKAPKQAPGKTN